MKSLIRYFFSPRLNALVVWGGALMLIGWLLLPFLIGFPLLVIGCGLLPVGAMISIVELFPGGKKLVGYYREMFVKMWLFLKALFMGIDSN